MKTLNIDLFVDSYLATAAWVTSEGDECTDFTRDAIKKAKEDCLKFIEKVRAAFGEDAERLLTIPGSDLAYRAPHDFFLTRNHHGVGFWDSENIYGEDAAKKLSEIAYSCGEVYCLHIRGKKSKLMFD